MEFMSSLPTVSWVFPGASADTTANWGTWPRWVVALNFACDDERMIIHTLEGQIIAYKGDTIHRNTVGLMHVVRAQA